ncbi:MAG: hypothetical protein WC707_06835 [Candidatus Babeliaceae bacterium]|jgi:DNA polymerase/3'-5' exonuclease PolX
MELNKAKLIAEEIKKRIAPYCKRIEIAGSVRRQKPDVGDIEICAIAPKRTIEFYETLRKMGAIRKGKFFTAKYLQMEIWERLLFNDSNSDQIINLDLFFAVPENWGYIFAIRTGSADFSHHQLANRWVKLGYKGKDGFLTRNGVNIPVLEETHLFKLLDIDFIEPKDRT